MTLLDHEKATQDVRTAKEQAEDAPTHGIVGHLSGDEALQQAVCAALLSTPGLDASAIEVVVLGHGEVTLLGHVATSHERSLALRVARQCAGDRVVHADLSLVQASAGAGR